MSLRILTDSVSDLPKDIVNKYEIEVLPLLVNFEDGSYRDGIDLTSEEFFSKLEKSKDLPTTSQVNPGQFIEVFEEVKNNGDEMICILMSSQMSGTYGAAITAKEHVGAKNVTIIESKAVTLGYGLLVIEAAKMKEEGFSREEIAIKVEKSVENLQNYFIVDTLEYLCKGGRLTSSEAFIGGMLNIKPILSIDNGRLIPIAKIRGRKKAMKWVINEIKNEFSDLSDTTIAIYNANDLEYMESFILKFKEEINCKEIILGNVGTVVGTHSGPSCLAVSFVRSLQ
jgi:DegV family protein with EDD domain